MSVQFGGFHAARRFWERRNNSTAALSLPQYYASGAFAGVTNSVLSGPIEHVRIRMQTQPHAAPIYSGPLDCIRTLVRHGGLPGLFRGQAVNVLREAQAYGVWFLTYEWLMAQDVARRNLASRQEVEAYRLAFYGGLAGEMLWLGSYPFDVIKSKMQTDGLGPPRHAVQATAGQVAAAAAPGNVGAEVASGAGAPGQVKASKAELAEKVLSAQRYPTMRDAFAQTWREDGFRGFWRGIGPTLARAMPVSGATFVV